MSNQQITPESFGRVAVFMGGTAAEREISLQSGEAVLNALLRRGVNAIGIDSSNLLESVTQANFDRVFNIIHGRGGEDGILTALLESVNIPYTGSGVLASALSMDKLRTKYCWQGQGLVTPAWFILKQLTDIDACIKKLGFPVIVKPALEGSSIGMSKANNREELILAWQLASQSKCAVFAEAWAEGEEFTVAILEGQALPVIRLETPNVFYDYEAKYLANNTQYYCPCGLTVNDEQALQAIAVEACDCVGITGWARVDVFVNQGNYQLIEVNTVPGMTDHSLVPMAAKAAGIEFDELVWRLLKTSLVAE